MQRNSQRRSPVPESHGSPVPDLPANTMPNMVPSQNGSQGHRNSSSSGRMHGQRRQNYSQQLSQIEKSVTRLLVATKQLLETLTEWSRERATESEVSDVYVSLGYEFNIACRAFGSIGVETSDLGNVPELLRNILEDTLSQDASRESLDRYLPRIRDIVVNLLQGLKRKQQSLRKNPPASSTSRPDGDIEDGMLPPAYSTGDGAPAMHPPEERISDGHQLPPRSSSIPGTGTSPVLADAAVFPLPGETHDLPAPPAQITPSSSYTEIPTINTPTESQRTRNTDLPTINTPPIPKHTDALVALQRGGHLERRASRRLSNFQLAKMMGTSPNGIPSIPTPQMSPAPNRGREVRESMNAVRTRGSTTYEQAPPLQRARPAARRSISGEKLESESDGKLRDETSPSRGIPGSSSTLEIPEVATGREAARSAAAQALEGVGSADELTLFLQYKSKIKKFVLQDGMAGLTMARLQLAFIEKFAWNTHENGNDLPEIYIQDPVSGVRHELEDLADVKDRCVLVLNVEALDEVKRHFDEGLGSLKSLVQDVVSSVESQKAAILQVSDRQQEAAKEILKLQSAPATAPLAAPIRVSGSLPGNQLLELQNLRRDLAVMRQTYSGFVSQVQSSMAEVKAKATSVKAVAFKASVPKVSDGQGRAYVEDGKNSLEKDSESLVSRVDDLADIVEDLRKDVITRGVRPLPRQLETVAKDIATLTTELKRMQEYLKREKPMWSKIWEKELALICSDREFLTMQEDLAADLEDDLVKASDTFRLVEECTKAQLNEATTRAGPKNPVNVDTSISPHMAKEGVLVEVRALQPNHENRLEAIERAERARQRELENRGRDEFQQELGNFVEEGKLKKVGGFEETERLRKARDEQVRREVWERQNGLLPASDEPPTNDAAPPTPPAKDEAAGEESQLS